MGELARGEVTGGESSVSSSAFRLVPVLGFWGEGVCIGEVLLGDKGVWEGDMGGVDVIGLVSGATAGAGGGRL